MNKEHGLDPKQVGALTPRQTSAYLGAVESRGTPVNNYESVKAFVAKVRDENDGL